ncbi:hypothetical protein [Nonomuraea jiangxiensis]|uniref:Response regulatory domain-containing protein n=1 Tax=Nonomuraea jiangxiensis TaxID=633440 RepID=A0A1G9PU63_9ACTN|nr:hypothetical protein [Nonomuraea jiangxiensis]SDM02294.1 hypothetical protein SAMN05421869_134104 [Nonomuraea jiangxiensis]
MTVTVTVAVTRLPGLLADVVREAFADDPLVRVDPLRHADRDGIDAAIERQTPDVVIVGVPAGSTDAGLPCDLLLRHRDLVVLTLSTDARSAWMCELRPSARPIREVSPAGLREVVHAMLDGRPRS